MRMTVECPRGKEPYGGGFLTSPPPGDDGQGIYPNSYERLGQQTRLPHHRGADQPEQHRRGAAET